MLFPDVLLDAWLYYVGQIRDSARRLRWPMPGPLKPWSTSQISRLAPVVPSCVKRFRMAAASQCIEIQLLHQEALETSGAAEALEARGAELSQGLEAKYNSRLLVHRPPSQLASAEDAAAFALAAQPEFEHLAFGLARAFGGHAEFPRKITASRMARLSRLQRRYVGEFCYAPGASIDWAAVVGGLEATLVLPNIPDVYKALAELDQTWPCKIRGIWDHLLRRDSARPSWQDGRWISSNLLHSAWPLPNSLQD